MKYIETIHKVFIKYTHSIYIVYTNCTQSTDTIYIYIYIYLYSLYEYVYIYKVYTNWYLDIKIIDIYIYNTHRVHT